MVFENDLLTYDSKKESTKLETIVLTHVHKPTFTSTTSFTKSSVMAITCHIIPLTTYKAILFSANKSQKPILSIWNHTPTKSSSISRIEMPLLGSLETHQTMLFMNLSRFQLVCMLIYGLFSGGKALFSIFSLFDSNK